MSSGYARYTRLSQDEDELEPRLELREQSTLKTRSEPNGIYFSNGNEPKRRIDYVLVYETKQDDDSDSSKERSLQSLRNTFEDNLRQEKLLIEHDELFLPQVRLRCLTSLLETFKDILILSKIEYLTRCDQLFSQKLYGINSSSVLKTNLFSINISLRVDLKPFGLDYAGSNSTVFISIQA